MKCGLQAHPVLVVFVLYGHEGEHLHLVFDNYTNRIKQIPQNFPAMKRVVIGISIIVIVIIKLEGIWCVRF